jgi:hypothetical protein
MRCLRIALIHKLETVATSSNVLKLAATLCCPNLVTTVGRSHVQFIEDSETYQPKARRDSVTGHERERGEAREEMLDLDRSLVAMELSAVFDFVAVDHDTPFTIFDRSSLLRQPLDVWREEEGVHRARMRSSSSLPRWRVVAASRCQA